MPTDPAAPIFRAAPHVQCPNGPLHAWYTDPPGAVVQFTKPAPFTADMARWLVGPAFEGFSARFAGQTQLSLVLDLRVMTSREPVVRALLMDLAREHGGLFSSVFLVPPLQVNPLYLTTLHGAAALIRAFGPKVEITTDLARILERDGIAVSLAAE